jgi:ketosteroid isomerase-like protein
MCKNLLLPILLLFQISLTGQTDLSAPFVEIMKTEFEAFQKKDPSLWLNHVHDDAVFEGTDNAYKSKEQIAGEMKNAPALFGTASETYENILTRLYGNTCVLSCFSTFSYRTQDGRTESFKFKFIRVHSKDDEGWKLVYHSAVPVE